MYFYRISSEGKIFIDFNIELLITCNGTVNVQVEWKNPDDTKKLDNMDYNLGENMKSFKHQLASHTKDENCSHAKGLSQNQYIP